jgi:hypothetical protein
MGNRLIAVLAFLNALGLFGCMILMASAISRDPTAVTWVTQALRLSVRLFVIGCALPAVAWGISAMEMNRAHDRVRILESWAMYLLLLASLVLFFVGSWRIPDSLLAGVSFRDIQPGIGSQHGN